MRLFSGIAVMVLMTWSVWIGFAGAANPGPVELPGIVSITATNKDAPPSWAIRQRHLISTMEDGARLFWEKFTLPDGALKRSGKLDDDYECIDKWTMLYAIGGDEQLLEMSLKGWNAITRDWTWGHGNAVHKEMVGQNDALHLSEGYNGFQYFALCDPTIPANIDRAKRFAGFYLGEDPDAFNYDARYKVIRGVDTGSRGPVEKRQVYPGCCKKRPAEGRSVRAESRRVKTLFFC